MNKKARKKITYLFETYRLCKYLIESQENNDSVDLEGAMYFCENVECVVNALPDIEAELIRERYLCIDSEYITDETVYKERMDPPISAPTYNKVRERAFEKIYTTLGIGEIIIKTPYVANPIFHFRRSGS